DDRFSDANGSEPRQSVVGASAYVGLPPWDAAAVPVALDPSDGTFDAPTEAVIGEVPTAGLGNGRHLVFVQGRDASGTPGRDIGTPEAVFIEVASADAIGTLQGTILSYFEAHPVVATVTASNPSTGEIRTTTSGPGGNYTRHMYP